MQERNLIQSIKKGGFTIIETMISISLFLVVMMVGMDTLLRANVIHQKSQDMRSIVDSLSFVLEDMSRNIRTGSKIRCFLPGDSIPITTDSIMSTPKSCASGWAIAFEPALGDALNHNDQWVYYILGGKVWKATTGPYAQAAFIQLTPDEVVVDPISGFSVFGSERPFADSQQPLVNIRLSGKITFVKNNVITPFSLQTSVSQRLIDILPL